MRNIAIHARCPECRTERVLVGPFAASTPAELDLAELQIDQIGSVLARCPRCLAVEEIAWFVGGQQVDPWIDADQAEREWGRGAGPLPRKPWPDAN